MYLCRCEIHRRYYFASDVLAFKRERKKQAPRESQCILWDGELNNVAQKEKWKVNAHVVRISPTIWGKG